jgi:hypothetical protein
MSQPSRLIEALLLEHPKTYKTRAEITKQVEKLEGDVDSWKKKSLEGWKRNDTSLRQRVKVRMDFLDVCTKAIGFQQSVLDRDVKIAELEKIVGEKDVEIAGLKRERRNKW